jgi:hypothetical protein
MSGTARGLIAHGQLTIVAGVIVDPKHAEATVRFFKKSERSVWRTVLSTWADRNARLGSASTGTIEVAAIDFCQVIRQYGMPSRHDRPPATTTAHFPSS